LLTVRAAITGLRPDAGRRAAQATGIHDRGALPLAQAESSQADTREQQKAADCASGDDSFLKRRINRPGCPQYDCRNQEQHCSEPQKVQEQQQVHCRALSRCQPAAQRLFWRHVRFFHCPFPRDWRYLNWFRQLDSIRIG